MKDLNILFPFGFTVDHDCRLAFVGASLQKIAPMAQLGHAADALFQVMKPSHMAWKFTDFQKLEDKLVLIRILQSPGDAKGVILRGQILFENDRAQFLVSPWLTSPEDLETLNLQINDFAIHDPVNDLLQIVQSHNLATKDLEFAAANILQKAKQVKRSENHLITLIENMSSGILVEDREGRVTHANQVFANTFANGIDASLLLGTNCKDSADQVKHLFADPERFVQRIHELVENGKPVKGEEVELHDKRVFTRDFIPLAQESGVGGYLWCYTDISKIKETEKRAIEASEEKSRFLATMSHEIRTPLNGVIGMSSLLLDTKLDRDQKEIVSSIHNSGETLLTIVNDILDFSKIEAGKMELEKVEFDLAAYCKDMLKIHHYSAEKKNIQLRDEISSLKYYVIGDEGRFGQILSNLVSNAIKFTSKGAVTVRLHAEETPMASQVFLSVVDTGLGIPQESRHRMFQAFTQADQVNARKFGGTGLGLSISKRLAEMMKGTIRFESEYGQGTTFFVEIPFARGKKIQERVGDSNSRKISADTSAALSGARILVAEDNPTNQKVIDRMLKRLKVKAHLVANGSEAIDALRSSHYDLILMDCQMPELDGYQATEIIRSSDSLPKAIPIVALTANAIKGDEKKCLEYGMNAYLMKPIKLRDLAACLEEQLVKKPISFIDLKSLEQFEELQIAGEPNILVETIDSFLKTSPGRIKTMVSAAKKKDFLQVSREAHCLKSSGHILGAKELVSLCLALEELPATKDEHRLKSLIQDLQRAYAGSCAELQKIRDSEQEKSAA